MTHTPLYLECKTKQRISIRGHAGKTTVKATSPGPFFTRITGTKHKRHITLPETDPSTVAKRLIEISPGLQMRARLYPRTDGNYTALIWNIPPKREKTPPYRWHWINNLRELTNEIGIEKSPKLNSQKRLLNAIARRIYQDTRHGISVLPVTNRHGRPTGIKIGSVVEGVEQTTETIQLTFPFTKRKFNATVAQIDDQAQDIWMATHGCPKCHQHWKDEELHNNTRYEPGNTAIWKECPSCRGNGTII